MSTTKCKDFFRHLILNNKKLYFRNQQIKGFIKIQEGEQSGDLSLAQIRF